MKEIQLTKGVLAIVDDDDYERVNSLSWYFNGRYASRREKNKTVLLHRFIIGTPPGLVTDHINGNRLDNRKSNLRVCTQSQNRANSRRSVTNTSGFKGVCFDKRLKKFRAYIRKDGVMHNLGLFKTAQEAHEKYASESVALFGEYSRSD